MPKRTEVVIYRIIEITPGGGNAWVETNVGRLKKPLKAIPDRLVKKFESEERDER